MTLPLAARLAEARRTRSFHSLSPEDAVRDATSAYRVQAEVARLLGVGIAGWKVGAAPPPERIPMAGPIFDCDLREDGGVYRLAPGEAVKVEVELGLQLARDVPAGAVSRHEILSAASSLFVGIELVGSRYLAPDAAPFESRVADNFNNAAYVVGPSIASPAGLDLAALPCRLRIDGATVTDHVGGHADGDPLTPLLAWAAVQADLCGGLKAGQFVTTGTLNVPFDMNRAGLIEAELAGIGRVTLRLET
jgi:2-keto-4-pentenoate hydratase